MGGNGSRLATRKLILDLSSVTYADAGGTHCLVKSNSKTTPSYLRDTMDASLAEQITRGDAQSGIQELDMGSMQNAVSGCGGQARMAGEFFNKLSPEAMKDLSSMAFASSYPSGMILFSEKDPVPGVYMSSRER